MKSNRPASRPTSEMSDMEKTRQMATTGDKPKPKTSTNKKPPSEMMPEAKDPAIDRLKILVRQGMMDKKDLPKIVRSLEKVKAGKEVAPADRKILFSLMGELLGMITGDEQMFQKARKKVREDMDEAMGARMHRVKMVDRINKSLAKKRNNPDEKDRDIQKINKSLEKQRQQKS